MPSRDGGTGDAGRAHPCMRGLDPAIRVEGMLRLSIAWPPVCHVCGQPILSLDTGVVVLSDEESLPAPQRARFAAHGFCLTEEPASLMDLRDFAKLVERVSRYGF